MLEHGEPVHFRASGIVTGIGLGLGFGLGLGLEKVFMFDSKSENRDRAVETVEA